MSMPSGARQQVGPGVASSVRKPQSAALRPRVWALALLSSVVMMELLLRIWISPMLQLAPPDARWTPLDVAPSIEIRQVSEGVATAHYSVDGRRNASLPAGTPGRRVILLGDSYVEASQLNDSETVGARLEQMSAGSARPVRVLQYGWSGAAPPLYIELAAKFKPLNPSHVALVLNPTDLTPDEVFNGRFVRFNRSFELVPNPDRRTRFTPLLAALKRSVLFSEVFVRAQQLFGTGTAKAKETKDFDARVVQQTVHQSKAAYGDTLVIVYLAEKGAVRPQELELQKQCAATGVKLINIRYEEEADPQYWRGFSNTVIGEGHLNTYGAERLAELIWKVVQ